MLDGYGRMGILEKLGVDEYDKNTEHKILREITEKCGNISDGSKKF